MSLIICEECGKEISDKAEACPHCGAPVEIADKQGVLESKELKEEPAAEAIDPVVVDKESVKKSKKILLFIIVILVAIIAGTAFGVIKHNEKIAKQKIAKQRYNKAVKKMKGNEELMLKVVYENDGSTKKVDTAEELVNLTNSVWHDAIFEESSKKTKKYVKGAKDFNEAIDNVYSDSDVKEFVSVLQISRDMIKETEIDCPEELLSLKDKYDNMLASFSVLVDYVEYPKGTYKTYLEGAQDKFDEFNSTYNKFDTACPEIKEDKE